MSAPPMIDTPCPMCGSTQYATQYVVDSNVRYVRCKSCTWVYLNPRYTDEYLRQIYQDFDIPCVERWRSGLENNANPGVEEYQRLVDQVLPYERLKLSLLEENAPHKSLLDVGFGAGLFLASAQRLGWDAAGVELKQSTCQFLTAMLNIPAFAGELPDVDLGDRQFGCVTMVDTLEHLTRPRAYLDKAYRLLKPGGVLFVSVPNTQSVEIRTRRGKARHLAPHCFHITLPREATLKMMLAASGFTNVVRVRPTQCKPLKGLKRTLESLSFAMGMENTLRVTARKPAADL